jgi:hypothetical protein
VDLLEFDEERADGSSVSKLDVVKFSVGRKARVIDPASLPDLSPARL